ncbi:hypothetical protein OKA04_18345 [Luteolibacter flavescens]|uniref:Zinc ribbon domain-containing protein n=1 Tax=Luteolibacter flavescens TaxID=1859460 RepID=A0ABT3FUN8_9BACT|nr:hypothetical protein [Luteolibacter flavescens]MCW1886705.1 hypothetical protein [Luteolibacter flavescens]
MIKFVCPQCHASVSADDEAAGVIASCPSCNVEILVPPAGSAVTNSWSDLGAPEAGLGRPAVPPGSNRLRIGLLCALVVIATCVAIWKYGGGLGLRNANPPATGSGGGWLGVPARIWVFTIGARKDECATIMKDLKSRGIFSELSSGRNLQGVMPGSEVLSGEGAKGGRLDLDGILSRPCEGIHLSFKDDRLACVELDYGFKSDYPTALVEILAEDMGRFLGTEIKTETTEDEVGNRTRRYKASKGSLTISINDRLDGGFSAFAPSVFVYDSNMVSTK